jgi:hypothetical protein
VHSLRAKTLLAAAVAVALAHPAGGASTVRASTADLCAAATCSIEAADALQVSLPDGSQPCPASGVGASCLTSRGADVTPGKASTPDGLTPCPTSSPLSTPAACSDPVPQPASDGAPAGNPSVQPSVPVSTIRPPASPPSLTLASSAPAAVSGGNVILTATASAKVLRPGSAIQIFDTTAGTLVGSCSQGTQCGVGYSADAGVHRFQAIVSEAPSGAMPPSSSVASDAVSVGWIDVSLATTQTALGPGKSATLTATSTVPVEQFGYSIQLLEGDRMTPITYCSRGTSCSVSVAESVSGAHGFTASVGPATSDHLSVTWLSVELSGTSPYRVDGMIHLRAQTNIDLTDTPWSLGILDAQGHLVAPPCKTYSFCTADVPVSYPSTPQFTAVIGAIPPAGTDGVLNLVQTVSGPANLINIQTRSATFKPARLLWGVDSCKAFTGDPTIDLYHSVAGGLGAPEFWGRYLTPTVCAGISSAEIAMAHTLGMGILPIYNDYECSDVAGYDTGLGYAQAAVAAAVGLQVPQGRVLAIDVEPPGPYCSGNVDAAFVQGWYDGITSAGYVPVYYGNGTTASEFATAYCAAESQDNALATGSYIWSFEPSLDARGMSKYHSPDWGPYLPGCPDAVAAWQYQIDVFSPNPNIDSDEALSTLPLWYP